MIAAALLLASHAPPQPTVNVEGLGTAVGLLSERNRSVAMFLGLPFAVPPVGKLRFQPPQPHPPWASTLDATAFGNICMQKPTPPLPAENGTQSEDCLFLNVAAPTSSLGTAAKLSVMVWVHGGAYNTGSTIDYADLDTLVTAGDPVVVVTVQYRLNVRPASVEPATS